MVASETELRERLVGFTFAAVVKRTACLFNGTSTANCWFPVGVAQMDSWVSMNYEKVHGQLQSIRSKIKELGSRYLVWLTSYALLPIPRVRYVTTMMLMFFKQKTSLKPE